MYLCVCVCVVEIILIIHYAMHLLCMVDAYWDTWTPEMLQKYIGDTSTRWWLLSLKKLEYEHDDKTTTFSFDVAIEEDLW